jgi:hypothetical protein
MATRTRISARGGGDAVVGQPVELVHYFRVGDAWQAETVEGVLTGVTSDFWEVAVNGGWSSKFPRAYWNVTIS